MTSDELLAIARKEKPNIKYYADKSGDNIGAFDEKFNRIVCVAGKLITGEWVSMPYELLVNGKPIKYDWVGD